MRNVYQADGEGRWCGRKVVVGVGLGLPMMAAGAATTRGFFSGAPWRREVRLLAAGRACTVGWRLKMK
jgi:hypothetical protein